MKKMITLLFVIILAAGCSRSAEQKDILAKVNNYEITLAEFKDEFKASSYGKTDTPGSRREFLANLINRKLILQDAQAKGLDKNANFLKMIQRFWEQSLIKLAIEKKVNEIAVSSAMGKADIKAAEERLLDNWIETLIKNANIKVNEKFLEEKT